MLDSRTIFRSDDLVVRFVAAAQSDVCFVTFDSYNDERTLDRDGFAERYLASIGVNAIHVISRNNDWYQYGDIPHAMALVREFAAVFSRVITYGTSMGGYAAIRFADMVGAHAAISLSPQYSIDPTKAPFENRWSSDAIRIGFLPELDGPISTRADVVIAFDPSSLDARHVELIAGDIAFRPIRVSYGGHSVPAMLQEAKLLDQLVQRVMLDNLDALALEREIRHRRRELAIYFAEMANRQPAHRPQLAIRLARRAAELNPNHDIAVRSLADRLGSAGEFEEAIELYESLLARSFRQVQYLLPFSRLLASSGQVDRATDIAIEIIDRQPENAQMRYWAATLLEKQGRLDEALDHVRVAARLEPSVSLYTKTAKLLASRLNRTARFAKVKSLSRRLLKSLI